MSKQSILDKVRRCKCGISYYIGIDGDADRCDGCIAEAELAARTDAEKQIDWHDVLTEGDCYP